MNHEQSGTHIMGTALKGIIHGKNIELTEETGLPEGQEVSVEIHAINAKRTEAEAPAAWWLGRLEVNPAVRPGKFVIKNTSLLADELVASLEEGWTEENLLQTHAGLAPLDLAAVREYAKVPVELRRCFGAWAEDAEELDEYLEWNRQQRKVTRARMDD